MCIFQLGKSFFPMCVTPHECSIKLLILLSPFFPYKASYRADLFSTPPIKRILHSASVHDLEENKVIIMGLKVGVLFKDVRLMSRMWF